MQEFPSGKTRLHAIDTARGIALVAMAVYHFSWDLEFFGYAPPGMTREFWWIVFARSIAGSFLLFSGVSLVLAHGAHIKREAFLERFAMIAGSALLITIATYLTMPEVFIFFGILHAIALFSLLGLLFLRAPWWISLATAAIIWALPEYYRSPIFDHPALWWVGLAPVFPPSNDYVPLFPWFAPFLAGIAVAKFRHPASIPFIASIGEGGPARRLAAHAGRHGLVFYLAHQPILIACVWLYSQILPPNIGSPETQFTSSCERTCQETRDKEFCVSYCNCVLGDLKDAGMLDGLLSMSLSREETSRVTEMAHQCVARIDAGEVGND